MSATKRWHEKEYWWHYLDKEVAEKIEAMMEEMVSPSATRERNLILMDEINRIKEAEKKNG